ncbi:zinc transporter, ZIP family [Halopenitus malekzadehii]|uniref:Zinc transporter, ZIP family n=1 Tax=Halopenitus malekzadehii TaxID=1267564 RepID=A0A1H6JGR4_9EURY|nr:ZIP family metal transporter [Halopenitus malekzadehii]SEH59983.1 zinc transporter, ZIP family [Halopenitus malekzadehii]
MNEFATMFVVATIAGAITGVGAIPVFFRARVSHRVYDAALGLAAGIMIAASVFGLILPGMDQGSLLAVMSGVFLGGFLLLGGNKAVPHVHARYLGWRREGGLDDGDGTVVDVEGDDAGGSGLDAIDDADSRIRRALLIGTAIVLHNAPEGLAMGVAFASGLDDVALLLAIVIGLQNVPDGFAFAVPVGETGISNGRVLVYTTLSGLLPQVSAAVVGFFLVSFATGIFPVAAGFAAGAMMAVVFREMIPSSHGHGYADAATAAFLVGFALLVVVDELLAV